MIQRIKPGNALERFEKYKLKNLLNPNDARESLRNCFRKIRHGISCALIVGSKEGVDTAMSVLDNNLPGYLTIVERKEDQVTFDNGAQIRIIPENNKWMVNIMMGDKIDVVQAKDGDPKVRKFKKIVGL